ncbi:MAG: hypothetical protein KDA96_17055, partial [Planctomycetaceae bacterium]|nr:hypothetical protein [Planctomycetaceae bacterium]
GGVGTDSLVVTINNLAPQNLMLSGPAQAPEDSVVTFTGSVSDLNGFLTGSDFDAEQLHGQISFGDGTILPVLLQRQTGGTDLNLYTFTARHIYTQQGTYNAIVTVHDDDGGVTSSSAAVINIVSATITTAPVLAGPAATTLNLRPTIQWTPVPTATHYEVWIASQSTGQNPYLIVSVAGASYTPDFDLGIGRYNIWVRAKNSVSNGPWSTQRNFTIDTRVVVNSPGRFLATHSPTLTWAPLPGAVRYDLWINDKPGGVNQLIRDTHVNGTSWTPAAELPLGLYQAWVRGIAADGTPGNWSITTDFYVMPAPTVTQGMNNTFDRTPTLTWNALNGAVKYEVYIADRSVGVFPAYLYQQNITGLSFTPAAPMPDGQYRVWVIGISAANVRSFWTEPMDVYVGGRTEFLTPTGTTSDTTPTFAWRTVDGADHYDLWVDQIGGTQQIIRLQNLTTTSFTPSTALAAGNYRAWVRAISTTGEVSVWSLELTFTIAAAPALRDEPQEILPNLMDEVIATTLAADAESQPNVRHEVHRRLDMKPRQTDEVRENRAGTPDPISDDMHGPASVDVAASGLVADSFSDGGEDATPEAIDLVMASFVEWAE